LGIYIDLNIMNLALNCWFYQCYNIRMLNAKLSPCYFTYLLFNLWFIKNNNKIYCRRWGCLSASETGDAIGFRQQLSTIRMKHLSWRSRWIILCTLEWRMAVSCEMSQADRCLFGLSFWLSTRSSTATRWMRGLLLPGCWTIVSVLQILFSRLSMLPTFQLLSRNSLVSFVHHTALTDRDFKWKSHLYHIFMILLICLQIFSSRQFSKVK